MQQYAPNVLLFTPVVPRVNGLSDKQPLGVFVVRDGVGKWGEFVA